ncbi:MAG: Gx transporter family protein [Oscillospiraceae bacterium]|jgi:heptaprenyl diphosphate synthase|nr:Gx transporter family protein [Oscillospiraceae bacterium]
MQKNSKAKKIALIGILGAQAIALSFLERLFPPLPGLPPGFKPGLSNIISMFAAVRMGLAPALGISFMKSGFVFLSFGFTSGFLSFCGGFLSVLVISFLSKIKFFGLIGLSVCAAAAHNAGQLAAAALVAGSGAVFGYFPVLLLTSLASGAATGLLLRLLLPALNRQSGHFYN